MVKIAVAGFHHETNTFSTRKITFADFKKADSWPALSRGEEIYANLTGKNIPISGFMEMAKNYAWSLHPVLWCNASPGSLVERAAFEIIAEEIVDGLYCAKDIDAIYLDLHGAMVCETYPDAEGELLQRIRARLDKKIPIAVSLDLHANVSEKMVELSDIIVSFRTYPHTDMAKTGTRTAMCLYQILARQEKPQKFFAKLPFLIPITAQCSTIEPMSSIYEKLAEFEQDKKIASISFTPGFPPADVEFCGPSLLLYSWDADRGQDVFAMLQKNICDKEKDFASKLWQVGEAIKTAITEKHAKPIILVDTQDNPGAGAEGNTVGILKELLKQNAKDAVIACICDDKAAQLAHKCGVGNKIHLFLGNEEYGEYDGVFTVEHLTEGEVLAQGPFYAGAKMDLGKIAVVSIKGIKIILISAKVQAADRAIFSKVNIDPEQQKILILKSSVHFRADFTNIAAKILITLAPGVNRENPEELPYKNLRKNVRLRPCGRIFS